MWRFDAGRTATSPHGLPDELELRWSRTYPARIQTWDDPLNNDLMQFDKLFEPIVVGKHVILGFNDSDKVVALHIESGEEVWRFYTDGPVRLAPAAAEGRVYFASDDGFLYCLDAESGEQLWNFRGGPSQRKVLGNRRVISMWPARGGPVVHDGHVYFAASIWPFMGTFIYDLDAATGKVNWVNDRTSASYIKQPHSAPSFAGIAPQGCLSIAGDYLLVPGGRSVPAAFDRQSGDLVHFLFNEGGKGNGGTFVMGRGEHYYVHTRERGVRRFDLKTGKKTALQLNEPVWAGPFLVTSDANATKAVESNEDGSKTTDVWSLPIDGSGDIIRAGRRLYVAGKEQITVVQLADDSQSAEVVETLDLTNVGRLVAGGNSLLAVCNDGSIHCFGMAKTSTAKTNSQASSSISNIDGEFDIASAPDAALSSFLQQRDADAGYGIVFGVSDHQLLEQLLASSTLQLIAVSDNKQTVDRLRKRFDAIGVYGKRVTVHLGTAEEFLAPQYIATLVVAADNRLGDSLQTERLQAMYRSVRPYGGLLWFPNTKPEDRSEVDSALASANLAKANVTSDDIHGVAAIREGSLKGAADWTHLYGNVANTVKSDDRLVKAPLGLLWFGGNTHDDVLPRHSHAPSEQVIGGRLFVEGHNSISARDVYTGRMLWKRDFDGLGTQDVYFDKSYKETPLSTKYNQVHIPGANARGTNFVATSDGIYIVMADRCEVLDPTDGKTTMTIVLPKAVNPAGEATWTYVGVYGDLLIAGVDFANSTESSVLLDKIAKLTKLGRAWSPQWFASRRLVVMERSSGKLLWHANAKYSFFHNGIIGGGGKLFLLDKLPKSVEANQVRRGLRQPNDYRIIALDAQTGTKAWEKTSNVFGTWLGYSNEHDILLHAGAAAPDRSMEEAKAGIVAIRGQTGEPIWANLGLKYSGPCIIHNDKIIMNSRSYSTTSGVVGIHDGKPILIGNPLTGEQTPWTYKRAYGCNTAVASEHLLTFRSGAAGFYDLNMQCGVSNLGGFRSGCTSNLIAADGVLNAPDFTRTCSCGYQNQTSLALVHMPEVDVWSINPFELKPTKVAASKKAKESESNGDDLASSNHLSVTSLGINFGAAGSRRADDGMVWMEFPPANGEQFPFEVTVEGDDVKYSRRHSSTATGRLPWVAASNVSGFRSILLRVAASESDSESSEVFNVHLHFTTAIADDTVLVQGESPWSELSQAHGGSSENQHVISFSSISPSDGVIQIDVQRPEQMPALTGVEIIAVGESD